ncbi:P-loop containing nucleoside triphosphate hydrolase protein, partial [Halenospora varia]
NELTEHHLKFCTDKIPFFSLGDKNSHQGKIANVSDKIFDEHIFFQLVLPSATKTLVQILVKNHTNGAGFDDFVKGRTRNCSPPSWAPGVGKTMTAEAVAEYAHRPLYVVTCGELGTTPPALEESFERVLDIASSFGAVLLLDEADVFLEQRTPHDVQRNALVSIFLRLLKYYKGILFLATNRVRTFDDAFHSRIHITLAYSNHKTATRERIWGNFGTHLAAELNIRDLDYKELAELGLNGRQIKNVLGSCKALAADRREKITMDDLGSVLEISAVAASKWLDN